MATEQENFWKGDFGDQYLERNQVDWNARIPFFRRILELTEPRSVLDVGTNAGWNLRALQSVRPSLLAYGVDINARAVHVANAAGLIVANSTVYDRPFKGQFDLVVTSGVLIHVAPSELDHTMRAIIDASKRYVLAVEYASDKEEEIPYRGHAERLWKRPFGKLYEAIGLKLIAEGEAQGFDRCHYWLMEKP